MKFSSISPFLGSSYKMTKKTYVFISHFKNHSYLFYTQSFIDIKTV